MLKKVKYFKTLILIDAQYIVVSKYKELSVAKLWPYINEISEQNKFFAKLKNIYIERDYIWIINSSINWDAITKLTKDTIYNTKSFESIDQNKLVEDNPAIYKKITEDVAQKGNDEFNKIWFI